MMPSDFTKGKKTLPILVVSVLGLAGCNGSSSDGGDSVNNIGGGGGGGSQDAQNLAIDREDAVISLARTTPRDLMNLAKDGQPIFVKGFSEHFDSPFGNRLPRNEECGSAFNASEDTGARFVGEFSECVITFLNGNQYRIDGGFRVSHGDGGSNTTSGTHDFSYEVEADNLEFWFLNDVENELALGGFTAYSWDGGLRLDYTETEVLTESPDWKVASDRFAMGLELECPPRLGAAIAGTMVDFNLSVADLSAVTAPSEMGVPMNDVTQSAQLIISNMAEGFDGTYEIETVQPLVLANDPFTAFNDPQGGIVRITGPDGFDITVEYEQGGYLVKGGAVNNRFAPSLSAAADDPFNVDSDAVPKFVADVVCELQA
ncbi:MAG: hypothetical protein LAT65_11000 [Saccharospirillum sp.]|nr:hypothetical protein [Saccharospirillum sp.]